MVRQNKNTHAYEPKPSILMLNCPRNGIFLLLMLSVQCVEELIWAKDGPRMTSLICHPFTGLGKLDNGKLAIGKLAFGKLAHGKLAIGKLAKENLAKMFQYKGLAKILVALGHQKYLFFKIIF